MPTYQYRCTECAAELEQFQKFSDPALTECPDCTGALRKVYSAVGVVFKGSGFYATDNRTKGKSNASVPSTGGGDGGSSSSSSASSDSSGSSEAKKSPAKSEAKAPAKKESASAG